MCLIQVIFTMGLARAYPPALIWVLTWRRSKCHRKINRIESFLTWKNVLLGLVTGSKYFYCWNLLFTMIWENVLVPEKCFSALVQGTHTETQGWQLCPLRAIPKPLARMWFLWWKMYPHTCYGSHTPMGLGGLELEPYPNVNLALKCSHTTQILVQVFSSHTPFSQSV